MSVLGQRGLLSRVPAREAMPFSSPFTPAELLIIEDAIIAAWARLQREGTTVELGEIDLTLRLIKQLDRLMNDETEPVPGFDATVFETPVRGGELANYLGTRREERPDMVFRRVGRAPSGEKTFWGLFVECKRIDGTAGMSRYCKDGLQRFVDGEYAWAVSIAMMLGYAAEGYSLPKTLEGHFRRKGTALYGRRSNTLARRNPPSRVWVSVHDREWTYAPPHDNVPGPIELLHLWLA